MSEILDMQVLTFIPLEVDDVANLLVLVMVGDTMNRKRVTGIHLYDCNPLFLFLNRDHVVATVRTPKGRPADSTMRRHKYFFDYGALKMFRLAKQYVIPDIKRKDDAQCEKKRLKICPCFFHTNFR